MKRNKPQKESKNQKWKYNHRLRRLTQIVFIRRGAKITTNPFDKLRTGLHGFLGPQRTPRFVQRGLRRAGRGHLASSRGDYAGQAERAEK
jgi:hypothetical protein